MKRIKLISRLMLRIWIALMLIIGAQACYGQFLSIVPDCCAQASSLQIKLNVVTAERDTIQAIGNRLIKAKDARIAEIATMGTARIGELNAQLGTASDKLTTVQKALEAEIMQNRFMGWGRRRAIKRILKQLIQ